MQVENKSWNKPSIGLDISNMIVGVPLFQLKFVYVLKPTLQTI